MITDANSLRTERLRRLITDEGIKTCWHTNLGLSWGQV